MQKGPDMHIDEITTALASDDLVSIKKAFLAVANYPKQENVTGLRAGNAMNLLEAAAEALRIEISAMPDEACKALGLADGATYAEGAGTVLHHRQTWADHFGMIFRAQ
jgi:hypothetical protein